MSDCVCCLCCICFMAALFLISYFFYPLVSLSTIKTTFYYIFIGFVGMVYILLFLAVLSSIYIFYDNMDATLRRFKEESRKSIKKNEITKILYKCLGLIIVQFTFLGINVFMCYYFNNLYLKVPAIIATCFTLGCLASFHNYDPKTPIKTDNENIFSAIIHAIMFFIIYCCYNYDNMIHIYHTTFGMINTKS